MFSQHKKSHSKSFVKVLTLIASISAVLSPSAIASERVVNIYNWAGQIGSTTIGDFQNATHIKINYDVFDSNEVLEGKLMAGHSGFDVVSPSDSFLARQIQSDIYLPLDKKKLTNWDNLDPNLMKLMQTHDPDNKYAIPYVWMTTGIGYNIDMVEARLGENAPVNSWDLVFNPENMEKLHRLTDTGGLTVHQCRWHEYLNFLTTYILLRHGPHLIFVCDCVFDGKP